MSYVNVSPGIGVIGMAFLMLQELFGGSLVGIAKKFGELDKTQLAAIATVAAGFTALLSLSILVVAFSGPACLTRWAAKRPPPCFLYSAV